MKYNHEIHGNLARLLATENLNIEHRKVDTAMFDVNSRTLTLPLWDKASDVVYQLLISHEAAHAIFTPNLDIRTLTEIPHDYINVVEDARIEKLMKKKYPGLKKIFYSGYTELSENDFFELDGVDLPSLNFADKVNIYFKCCNYYKFDFTEEEKDIINLINDTETFDDVIHASEVLYAYCKVDNNQCSVGSDPTKNVESSGQQNDDSGNLSNSTSSGESNSDSMNSNGQLDSNQSDSNGGSKQQKNSQSQNSNQNSSNGQSVGSSGFSQKNDSVKTMQSYQKAVSELTETKVAHDELLYLTIPNLNLDNIIVSNKQIHSKLKAHWTESSYSFDADYIKFKKSAQKEVSYLIKEFECKKAAESYSRASESKTGILDSNMLNTYKFNDDIFKKITTVMDGKNHGLIFILDWSGSMSDIMLDTCKQLYNLIWFCKKLSIPFEVYAFTTSWGLGHQQYKPKENQIGTYCTFHLMNLITSKVNTATLDLHMKHIYRIASCFCSKSYMNGFTIPSSLSLSGTPLNETLLCLYNIIPQFQKTTKVHKVQCVILTDGECSNLPMHQLNVTNRLSLHNIGGNCYLKDVKLKTTYKFPDVSPHSYYSSDHEFTNVILRNLRDNFPTVNFIGIRLLEPYSSTNFIAKYSETNKDRQEHLDQWKRTKSCSIKTKGYHTYFGLNSNSLSDNSQLQVNAGASSSEIKNAFKKIFVAKKTNKKILSDFIDLIA